MSQDTSNSSEYLGPQNFDLQVRNESEPGAYWWAGISAKYPRRKFTILGKYGIFRSRNEPEKQDLLPLKSAPVDDFGSPATSSEFDFGRGLSLMPEVSSSGPSDDSFAEATPITLESCLKTRQEGIHHEPLTHVSIEV